jgi:phosphatidylglycerol:prolipoprotein diacylglycerol transferase
MIPYLEQQPIVIGPARIYPFGVLAATGLLAGVWMLRKRAAAKGLDQDVAFRFGVVSGFCGLIGAILLRLLIYDFQQGGMYSFGGLLAGLAGGWLYLRSAAGAKTAAYFDAMAFVFPFAWMFGRAGCAIAHDHPGIRSSHWLAVAFAGGGRFDLGLLELLFLLPLAALFLWLDRRPRPAGFFLGTFLAIYGAFRFCLDGLHEPGAPRFLLTPDQAMGLLAAAGGTLLLLRLWIAAVGQDGILPPTGSRRSAGRIRTLY